MPHLSSQTDGSDFWYPGKEKIGFFGFPGENACISTMSQGCRVTIHLPAIPLSFPNEVYKSRWRKISASIFCEE